MMWNKSPAGRDWGAQGELSRAAKLTEEQVRAIKQELRAGKKQREIANEFGITVSLVSSIHLGRTWGHVKVDNP